MEEHTSKGQSVVGLNPTSNSILVVVLHDVMLVLCVMQVNAMEQGKTAVHVAVEECRLQILEVLIKFNADVSKMVRYPQYR